jgi:hypothetical protein
MEAISTLRNRSVKERNKRGLIRRERACILVVVVPLDEAVALRDAGLKRRRRWTVPGGAREAAIGSSVFQGRALGVAMVHGWRRLGL